jgi:hypothetical protein
LSGVVFAGAVGVALRIGCHARLISKLCVK